MSLEGRTKALRLTALAHPRWQVFVQAGNGKSDPRLESDLSPAADAPVANVTGCIRRIKKKKHYWNGIRLGTADMVSDVGGVALQNAIARRG